MKYFLVIIMLLCVTLEAKGSDYILVDEFFALHPQEEKNHKSFTKVVKNPPIKLSMKQDRPVKITTVYPSNQISDYWSRSKVSFEKRLQELGIEYELTEYFTKPAVEVEEQARQILKAVKNNADYLVFTLDASKHKKLIEQILRLKKPKLILQNITTPLKIWQSKEPMMYVGFDHVTGSRMLADYFVKNSDKNATYGVLFYTEDGYISAMRGDAFIERINSKSSFKLADSFYTNVDFTRSYNATKLLLEENPDIDFIYACSTDIAFGALKAKEELSRDSVKINGWGGGSDELQALRDGRLEVTVMRMNDDNGVAMAEAIKLDLENRDNEIPKLFSGELKLIEQSNIDQIDIFINRAFRYSGR